MDSQAFNIMTILADYSFIHLITPKNHFISTPIIDHKQDPFIYITTECYTPKEFYGVMIDTSASKKSTIGYRQYLAYKATTNDNTDINITQTGALNVQFSIGSTALIKSIAIKTPIGLVDFYIIKADTPFLLYLVNIDRL